jgi:hypothetical protein
LEAAGKCGDDARVMEAVKTLARLRLS